MISPLCSGLWPDLSALNSNRAPVAVEMMHLETVAHRHSVVSFDTNCDSIKQILLCFLPGGCRHHSGTVRPFGCICVIRGRVSRAYNSTALGFPGRSMGIHHVNTKSTV